MINVHHKPWKGDKIDQEVEGYTTETLFPSGALLFKAWINGELVQCQYMGYTRSEAIQRFKQYIKEQQQ